jgi:UDP-N-acetylmuramoylalanine--D-glutamate ligase
MQPVGRRQGVEFVDDAKSTTLSSLAAAVRMSPPGVRLIAGGVLKEHDLHSVKELLATRAAGVYLIGRAAPAMHAAWSDEVRCEMCGDLATAVGRSAAAAAAGETVLLSPGCASFDQFANFEERGRRFVSLVNAVLGDGPRCDPSSEEGIRWTGKYLGVR